MMLDTQIYHTILGLLGPRALTIEATKIATELEVSVDYLRERLYEMRPLDPRIDPLLNRIIFPRTEVA